MYDDVPLNLYPRYVEKQFSNRQLAYYDGIAIVTEHQDILEVQQDLLTFVDYLFSHELLCFVDQIALLPFLEQLIDDTKATVFCDRAGVPLACKIHRGRYTRWIVQSHAWGYRVPSIAMLHELRAFYAHVQVGTPSTPGATGQALMRRTWAERYGEGWYAHRHQRPSGPACKQIRERLTGARSDVLQLGQLHSSAWELDQHNAYAAAALWVPTGKTYRTYGEETDESEDTYATTFNRCTVTIIQPLVLGSFPVRLQDETLSQRVAYPTQPGTYETWLWKEEIFLTRESGCVVEVFEGWGWEKLTNDLEAWVKLVEHLRQTAPTKDIAEKVKHCIVAGLGRFNLADSRFLLSGEWQEGDSCVAIDGVPYDWWIHEVKDPRPMSMPHWYAYILMKTRLTLYVQALPYAEQEQLIATNTDAIYVTEGAAVDDYPEKESGPVPSGTWRKKQLTNIKVPALRWLESDQKTTRPGKRKKGVTDG